MTGSRYDSADTGVLAALAAQRTTRAFIDEPVPRVDLERIVDAARWTGSARNRQPWRFRAVTDRPTREQLGTLGAYAGHLATAPLVLVVLSADDGFADTEFDAGRVVQSVSLAAAALGLASCVATFHPAANVSAAASLVHAGPGWLARHALSLGRPVPGRPSARLAIPTGRLPVRRLLTFLPAQHD